MRWHFLPPVSLWDDLTEKYGNSSADLYFRCPAAINELKRTFVVRSGLPIKITYNEDGTMSVHGYEDDVAEALVVPLTEDGVVVNFGPSIILFADESVNITQTPCYHHKSPLDHLYSPSGTYDISKWFRPLVTPLINPERKSVNVRRGDPVYYFRVNTDKKVNLIQFHASHKLRQYSYESVVYKKLQPNKTLKALYEAFVGSKRRNSVLSEIRQNLLE